MNYHKIEKTSIANGTGIRVVLWVSGCSLYCKGCHNPETWCIDSGKLFDESAKQELFEALDKPYIQGITFSGGHPLEKENVEDIYNLILEIRNRFPKKDIWIYTGLTWESLFLDEDNLSEIVYDQFRRAILLESDIVVDGRYIEEQRDITLKYRGSKNQRVIDVKKTLEKNEIVLYKE